MKLFSNNRQKLTLNRVRKPSTPPKMEMEVINGCKLAILHTPLSTKDENIVESRNSSIFKKQTKNGDEARQRLQKDLIRCRSISWLDLGSRSNAKMIPTIQNLNSQTQEEKHLNKKSIHRVRQACRNMLSSLKQKGILALKNNFYCIPIEGFNSMVAQLIEKSVEEVSKTRKKPLNDISQNKDSQYSECYEKHGTNFKVFNQFSLNQQYQRPNRLSFQTFNINININLQYELNTIEKQSFWKIIEDYEAEKPTEQNLNFLLQKIKYLKHQITNKENQLQKRYQSIEQLGDIIGKKNKQLLFLQQKIQQHQISVNEVEKVVKEIESFVNKQPNRILQQEAEGYKQRQQQLFDLAFLLEQSAPSSITTFVEETIMIPCESFKLTLKTFPHQLHDQGSYNISIKEMDAFKASANSAYESTVEKLKIVIERKAAKIKNFVGIMRRLASYTIGKRQYLTEVNKKMAVASLNAEKLLGIIEQQMKTQSENIEQKKVLVNLRQLINSMKSIYCQAEVFY